MSPVLLLDIMDTLVRDPIHREIPGFFGLDEEQLLARQNPEAWIRFESGQIDEPSYFQRYFADGPLQEAAAYKQCVRQAYAWFPGMEPLVSELFCQGVEMHALSNYPLWYRWIDEQLGLSRFLKWSFVSCHTGLRKPSSEAFELALLQLEVSPDELLFVDDRPVNCAAAEAAGLPSLQFQSASQLRDELAARGIYKP